MNVLEQPWLRRALIGVLAAVLLVGAAALWLPPFGLLVRDNVARWMGDELHRLAGTHLRPTLEFDAIEYDFPLGANAENVRLVADNGDVIIEIERLAMSLLELPSANEPLVIESVEGEGVAVRLLVDDDGALSGFSNMMKSKREAPTDGDEGAAVSKVFQLRNVSLLDVRVEYRSAVDAKTTFLDDLKLVLAFDRAPRPGTEIWYPVNLHTERGNLLNLDLKGRLSLDAIAVEIEEGRLEIAVDDTSVEALPPRLQQLADTHDARGRLDVGVVGLWHLTEPSRSALAGSVKLHDFNVARGSWAFPMAYLHATVAAAPGVVSVPDLEAKLLGGELDGTLRIATATDAPTIHAGWNASGIDLGQLLRAKKGTKSRLGGMLQADGAVAVDLADPETSMRGHANLEVRDGTLLVLPGLEDLGEHSGKDIGRRHRGDARLGIHGEGLDVRSLNIEAPIIGINGEGEVRYDGTLDMTLAIGPLQKIHGGPVRDAIAKLSSVLLRYRLHGTVSDPKISPRPFGIGTR